MEFDQSLANERQTIAASLNATSVQAYWAGTSFVLSSAVCQPVIAAFSNAFGRKPVILFALLLFAAGTIICGTARSIAPLLVGRTIQGAGGGGMLTMSYVVMADLLSLRARAKGMSVISLVWLVGSVVSLRLICSRSRPRLTIVPGRPYLGWRLHNFGFVEMDLLVLLAIRRHRSCADCLIPEDTT